MVSGGDKCEAEKDFSIVPNFCAWFFPSTIIWLRQAAGLTLQTGAVLPQWCMLWMDRLAKHLIKRLSDARGIVNPFRESFSAKIQGNTPQARLLL